MTRSASGADCAPSAPAAASNPLSRSPRFDLSQGDSEQALRFPPVCKLEREKKEDVSEDLKSDEAADTSDGERVERYAKQMGHALLQEEMEQVLPWSQFGGDRAALRERAGDGRPQVGLERVLRVYVFQQRLNLSDPLLEWRCATRW